MRQNYAGLFGIPIDIDHDSAILYGEEIVSRPRNQDFPIPGIKSIYSQAGFKVEGILVAQASACGVSYLQGLNPHKLKPVPLKPE
jgi:hypothetical protein